MVLYCVPKLRLMGQKFSVREKIDIAGMEVRLPDGFFFFFLKPSVHSDSIGSDFLCSSVLRCRRM